MSIVENIRWPSIDKYKCLNDITLQDMLDYSDNYTNQLYVQTLMQGNLTEESAHNVMNSVLSTLNCQHIKEVCSLSSIAFNKCINLYILDQIY